MSAEARLIELKLDLPGPREPAGTYVPCVRTGSLLYVSGHGGASESGGLLTGKVGRDLDLDQAIHAARLVGISLLGTMRAELGSLDEIVRIVKVFGMVNSAEGFNQQPAVINGCSDLFLEVFGEQGRHARSAVGMAELPSDIPVEIELIAEIR